MCPLLPGLCTGRVFSDKEASGHMSIPTARETAGVQDDAAWLPGNSGHHGNAASTEGAGASAAPPAEEGRGRQWQGLCPDHPDDTCLPALPFSPARPLGQRLWGPGASTAQGWGPGVRPSSLSRHLPCVPALEPWFPHQPHTVATAAPPSPLAVSAPRQVLPRARSPCCRRPLLGAHAEVVRVILGAPAETPGAGRQEARWVGAGPATRRPADLSQSLCLSGPQTFCVMGCRPSSPALLKSKAVGRKRGGQS